MQILHNRQRARAGLLHRLPRTVVREQGRIQGLRTGTVACRRGDAGFPVHEQWRCECDHSRGRTGTSALFLDEIYLQQREWLLRQRQGRHRSVDVCSCGLPAGSLPQATCSAEEVSVVFNADSRCLH